MKLKLILSEEETNPGRQREFDYAKVIAIIFMVLIHVWEELSCFDTTGSAPVGFWQNLLQFGAGPLGAPVFMFAMGVGICYSAHNTPKELATRGVKLFLMGYILNFCRNGIFYAIFYHTRGEWDIAELIYQCFNGDILHFAGLTFLLVALLKKCGIRVPAIGGISVLMQVCGFLLSEYLPVTGGWRYVVGLFYFSEGCCFPLLQWFIYPVAGIIFAKYLRHTTDKDLFYRRILSVSAVFLAGFCSALFFAKYNIQNFYILMNDVCYRQEFLHSLFTISVILSELALIHFATRNIKAETVNKTVGYISARLNTIYIIQWMLIGAAKFIMDMANFDRLDARTAILTGFVFIVLSILSCRLYDSIKTKSISHNDY